MVWFWNLKPITIIATVVVYSFPMPHWMLFLSFSLSPSLLLTLNFTLSVPSVSASYLLSSFNSSPFPLSHTLNISLILSLFISVDYVLMCECCNVVIVFYDIVWSASQVLLVSLMMS